MRASMFVIGTAVLLLLANLARGQEPTLVGGAEGRARLKALVNPRSYGRAVGRAMARPTRMVTLTVFSAVTLAPGSG